MSVNLFILPNYFFTFSPLFQKTCRLPSARRRYFERPGAPVRQWNLRKPPLSPGQLGFGRRHIQALLFSPPGNKGRLLPEQTAFESLSSTFTSCFWVDDFYWRHSSSFLFCALLFCHPPQRSFSPFERKGQTPQRKLLQIC